MSWQRQKHQKSSKRGENITCQYVEVRGRRFQHGTRRNKIKSYKSSANNDSKNIDILYDIHPDYKPDAVNTVHFNARVHSKPTPSYHRRANLPSTNRNYRSSPNNPPGLRPRNTHKSQIVEYAKGGVICIESPYNALDLDESSDHSSEVRRQHEKKLSIDSMSSGSMSSESDSLVQFEETTKVSEQIYDGVGGDYQMICEKVKRMSISSPEFRPSTCEFKPEVENGELINMVERMNLSNYIDNIFVRFLGSRREGGINFVDTFDRELAINIAREVLSCMNHSK